MDQSVAHAHPGARTYIKLAVILAVITVFEVALHYLPLSDGVVSPSLLTLTVVKFALVVMYYMHLKFDARLLSGVFLWGLFMAMATFIGVIAIFRLTIFA